MKFVTQLGIIAALCSACGTAEPYTAIEQESLFPLAVGYRWEFQVTKSGDSPSTKVQTVTGTASVDGLDAFVLTSENDEDRTVSVQYLDGTKLMRASEISYEDGIVKERLHYVPAALRLDTASLAIGTRYQNEHTEEELDENGATIGTPVEKKEIFIVEAVDDPVTVPAGTFSAVRLRRTSSTGSAKTYWYVPGLGKIKEVGGQTEALVSAQLD